MRHELVFSKLGERPFFLQGAGIVIIVLLTGFVYFDAIEGPFQYDDHHSIVDNANIRSLQSALFASWSPQSFSDDPRSAMYRPLVLISYALNYALHEYETTGYHLLNIAIHALNSCLPFLRV